jgi:DNA-binding NtrC family response regulator
LFYRLAVIHIELPPLRQRGDDVLLLARHFLRQLKRPGHRVSDFSGETESVFRRYTWPGNIRELRNAVEHALAMARTERVTPADLPQLIQRAVKSSSLAPKHESVTTSRAATLGDAERDFLIDLMRHNSGNVARSAQQADMSRQGLHKLLKKHGIDAAEYRR